MSGALEHKKRIGLVLSQVPGYSETFFRNKIKGLQAQGFEVVLFVDQDKPKREPFLCEVRVSPFSAPLFKKLFRLLVLCFQTSPLKWFQLYSLHRKSGRSRYRSLKNVFLSLYLMTESLDWLHFGFGALAVHREHVAEVMGARMGVSFRGFDLYLSPLKEPTMYKILFSKPCVYHVLSQEMKTDLVALGVPEVIISVITPAIDVSFFKGSVSLESLKRPLRILTVARLHWKKGLEYTLKALALLKSEGVNFKYTIVGTGDQYERLVFATHQLGLQNQVSILGERTPEQVREAYKNHDVYLQYSIQEGFCNAVLEAQAMGLLCVVSDAEGLPENVLHGETGWVVPKRQPEFLAQVLIDLLGLSSEDMDAVRVGAMRRVQKEFGLEQQREAFGRFFNA